MRAREAQAGARRTIGTELVHRCHRPGTPENRIKNGGSAPITTCVVTRLRSLRSATVPVALVVVLALVLAAPAVGAPDALQIARRALNIAARADRSASKALKAAKTRTTSSTPADGAVSSAAVADGSI